MKQSPAALFPYSPSLESTLDLKIKEKTKLFIGGKWLDPASKKFLKSYNPATGKILSSIANANELDVDLAVKAANKAYQSSWSKLSGKERGGYLYRIARLILEHSKELSLLETLDNGKPIKDSRDIDVPLTAAHFFYYAGWADKLDYIVPGKKVSSLGVIGQIIPWNFPLIMAAWKIAPALALGNTVVIKPAASTSLSLLLLAEIFEQAELPPGVINIITGGDETGAALVNHPKIDKIAFTGSTSVGKIISKQIASTDKKCFLELGGKSAHIVFEDAAIDQAIEGVVDGIFYNQGHVCSAGSRLLLEESISKIFVEKLKRRINQIRVGNPLDKNTDVGAIHSEEEFIKIKKWIEIGHKENGEYFQASGQNLPDVGFFMQPCFFNNVSSSFSLNRQEIFGPVLCISTFRTCAEAILKANNSPYGLAAGIWSDKGSKILKVADELKAGTIWANSYNKFDPTSPFGGFFESGHGREGGRHGLFPYLEIK